MASVNQYCYYANMVKRPFTKKPKRKKHGVTFWDNEYTHGGHIKLSAEASEDLKKFTRWLLRQSGKAVLNQTGKMLDVGCGNGRNLKYLAATYGLRGIGYDTSSAAIAGAKAVASPHNLNYETRSITANLPLCPDSQSLVLDMMASHFLSAAQREHLRGEIYRVLKPGGWLFMKTFLADKDRHTVRLLKSFGAEEAGTYIHPVIGVAEHVYYEDELIDFLSPKFIIHKIYRSHKHIRRGESGKRRTVSVYAQKDH